MGNQGPILAVPALGVCPSDAPPGAGGRDKATCTQVGPQTSTVTSFRACLKGMGVGTGASLSQKTFDALGILCPREAPSVLGAGLGLVTQTVPWMLRTTPRAPSWCVEAGTGRVSVRRSVWGRQVSWSQLGGGGRASPLIHSRSCSHSWAPLNRRPPAAQVRLGCSALVLRPPPSGEQPPGCPGAAVCASCQCPRPTGTLTGGRLEGLPELCLLASPGSGGAGPRGGRGFPRCSLSRPVWPGLPRPP